MLNRLYYLQTGFPVEEPAEPDGITVAHLVDGRPGGAAALLGHLYSAAGNYPFCLAVKDCGSPVAAVKQLLLLFLHPSYEMTEKGRPVFVWAPAEDAAAIGARMQDVFRAQRIETDVIFVDDGTGRVLSLHAEEDDPAAEYSRYCLTRYRPGDVFLLTGGELPWWQRQLKQIVSGLEAHHAAFHRLATERLATGRLAATRGREIMRLSEELQIMRQLLELSSKQNEVEYILRFYRNEYEILPLWYKRFGHLIKVIQGKRNFRSLFDKNVKKYKD